MMNDARYLVDRPSRCTVWLAMLAGMAMMSMSSTVLSAGLAIEVDGESEMTGVIDSIEGNQVMLDDISFVLVPASRVLTRKGRELRSFHLQRGQEVRILFDPRSEPRAIRDITLLRRGG